MLNVIYTFMFQRYVHYFGEILESQQVPETRRLVVKQSLIKRTLLYMVLTLCSCGSFNSHILKIKAWLQTLCSGFIVCANASQLS